MEKSVYLPRGYQAAGVACGIKKNGKRDLAVITSDVPAAAAGVFTRNVVKGHSLKWSMAHIKNNPARAIVINSGNANACVGPEGDADASLFAAMAANLLGCPSEQVLLGSTGVIGYRLPMDKIEAGLREAFGQLSVSGAANAVEAIMTTDTFPKLVSVQVELSGKTATIFGMAKGSGMIHPNMGTMIGVLLTDAAIGKDLLQKALVTVVDKSFNRVSVDGDTSVCDKVLLLANGLAGNPEINTENADYAAFVNGLENVSVALSKMLAKDGEGATKLVEVRVKQAPDVESAHLIANAVCKSPLVKTMIFGQDANSGRILTAVGYSGVDFNPDTVDIWIGDLLCFENGVAIRFDEDKALEILKKDEVTITVDLKAGSAEDTMWTCDFSYDYVKINGSYRT
jgi:glutamate N-acetyltransferase/amino-acid N-acetyltransferase